MRRVTLHVPEDSELVDTTVIHLASIPVFCVTDNALSMEIILSLVLGTKD